MRLLAEVLRDHQPGAVEGRLPVAVDAAHDELRAVDVVDRAAGPRRAALQRLERLGVVGRVDEVVEHDAVGDLAGQLHHLHARSRRCRSARPWPAAPGTRSRARRRRGGRGSRRATRSRWPAGPRTASTTSRITRSGRARSMPTFVASGSHHAPSPHRMRPGARSSSVENVLARRAALRVQMSMTPEPTRIRSVAAANAAIGTTASRTSRLSACQTASKPSASARCTSSMPWRRSWASCRYRATGWSAAAASAHPARSGLSAATDAGTASAMLVTPLGRPSSLVAFVALGVAACSTRTGTRSARPSSRSSRTCRTPPRPSSPTSRNAAGDVVDDAAELAARNLAAEPGERAVRRGRLPDRRRGPGLRGDGRRRRQPRSTSRAPGRPRTAATPR